MKRLVKFLVGNIIVVTMLIAVLPSKCVEAAESKEPLVSIDFAQGAGDVVLTGAEIVNDSARGNVLRLNGGSSRTSYGTYTTDVFENNDWTNGMTLSAWVQTTEGGNVHGTAPIYSVDMANQGYIATLCSLETTTNTNGNEAGFVEPLLWNDPVNAGGGVNKTAEGVWQLITVVYDPVANNMKIYVDGEYYATNTINNGDITTLMKQVKIAKSITLGSWNCSWWKYGDYKGLMDDFNLWNSALSADEIKELYRTTMAEGIGLFEMTPGGSIRVAQPYGLRFQVRMDDDVKAYVEQNNGKVGMFIFPADYLANSNTAGDVYYKNVEELVNNAPNNHRINLDLTEKLYEKDGLWYGNGAIVNIKEQNMAREFVGIAYYEVNGVLTLANTQKLEATTRSASQVALLTHADKTNEFSDETKQLLVQYIDYLKLSGVEDSAPSRYKVRGYAADDGLHIYAVQYADNVVTTGDEWNEQTHLEAQIWQHNMGYGVTNGLNVDTYFAFFLNGNYFINTDQYPPTVQYNCEINELDNTAAYRYEICYDIFLGFSNNLENPADGPYAFIQFKHHMPDEEGGFGNARKEHRDDSRYLWQDKSESTHFRAAGMSEQRMGITRYAEKIADRKKQWEEKGTDGKTTLFIGDSFFDTDFWSDFYTRYYAGKDALLLGIGSTTTYDWETWATEWLKDIQPKNIVMHMGTNNIYDDGDDVEATVSALQNMFSVIHENVPDTPIYWFGISYRSYNDAKIAKAKEINAQMKTWCDTQDYITYIDTPDTLTADMLSDGTHPKVESYYVFADALKATNIEIESSALPDMLIDTEITNNMAKLEALDQGQPLPVESGQALFTDRTYVVDKNVAPSLYGKSYFYNSIDSSKCKVVEDGYVIVVFPNPYTAIREQAVEQGFSPLLVDKKPFGRRFGAGPMGENVDYYVKYCQVGEEISFNKWAIVIFETLNEGEYFVPDWIGTPGDLISDPSALEEYDISTRLWQGIPSIEKTTNGRYFAGYGSGGNKEPQTDNYTVYAYSDDGKTWKDLMAVAHSSAYARCFDASVWIDPNGQLWMFWSQGNGEIDGFIGVWAITIDPNGTEAEMREAISKATPRRIADGIKLNKPIVLSDGSWMFPVLDERSGDYNSIYVSVDQGATWTRRSTAIVTGCLHADEPMILELAPNELALYVRSTDGTGIRVAYSHDNGYSWEESVDSGLGGPCSRFHIRRLPSGNILLVNHYENYGRSSLTALLSTDNGKTWEHSLLIDQRVNCSYPDATVSEDGVITLTWDYERNTHGCIYMAEFTEEDIIQGGILSRSKISIISEVTNVSTYESDVLGNSDDFFATRGFVVNDEVATQNVGGEHEIYFKDIEHKEFYVSTEITAEGIYNNDAYPKFGVFLRYGRQTFFFYIDGGNNLTNKRIGYAYRDNWTWDWDKQVTKVVDIAYTNGQYAKLAILSNNGQLVLYLNDEAVFTVPLSEEWKAQDVSVGFKTFNTKAHFRNNIATTDQNILEIIAGENAVNLEGKLVDVVGNVVANATISAGTQTVTTDTNGKFTLQEMTCGNSSITVSASGFITQTYSVVLNDFLESDQGVVKLSALVLTREYVDMGSLTATKTKSYTWSFASTRNQEGFLYRFVSSEGASAVKNEVNIWMSVGSTEPDAGTTSGRNRGFWQFQFIRNADGTLSLNYRNAPKGSLGTFRAITSGITWTTDEQGVMTIECLLPYSMFKAYDSTVDVSSDDIVGMMYTIAVDGKENAKYIYTFGDGTQHTSDKAKVKSILRIDANNYIFVSETNSIPDKFLNVGKLSGTNSPTWDLNIYRVPNALYVKASTTDEINTTVKTGVKLFMHLAEPSTTRTEDTYVFDCVMEEEEIMCTTGYFPEGNYVATNINPIGKSYTSASGVTTISLVLPFTSFDPSIGTENIGVAFESYCGDTSATWLYSDSYFTTDCMVDSSKPTTYLTISKDNQVYLLGEEAVQAVMEEKGVVKTDYQNVFANLATISADAGEIATITNGGYMFKDRLTQNYLFQTGEANFLEGKKYVYANLGSTKFTVTESGYVFLLVPDSGNFDTLNTNVKNGNWNLLFSEWNRMGKLGDRLNYYVKWCEEGESYNYGRWTLVGADSE